MDRKEALKTIADTIAEGFTVGDRIFALENEEEQALKVAIEALQEPERKKGHWKVKGIAEVCDQCGKSLVIEQCDAEMNYCPFCGADMRGEEEWANQ